MTLGSMFLLWGQVCSFISAVCMFYQLTNPARVKYYVTKLLPGLWCSDQNTLKAPGSVLASRDDTWHPRGV